MFNPEKEVASLELCRKLKELGYPQDEGGWYWAISNVYNQKGELIRKDIELDYYRRKPSLGNTEYIKPPTVAEMWEWLPFYIKEKDTHTFYLEMSKDYKSGNLCLAYKSTRISIPPIYLTTGRPVEVMGMTLIWLAENNYINFRKGE